MLESVPFHVLAAFLAVLAGFHLSEALFMALIHRRSLAWGSFLISRSYCAAMSLAIFEFLVEAWLFPSWKSAGAFALAGATLIFAGEALRKAAIIAAGTNFTHQIATEKSADHRLVTRGVYAWCRHPAYLGWSLWCIGTQLLLANPICTIAFAIAAWRFFADRIAHEEQLLMRFFCDEFRAYQARVPVGLPLMGRRLNSQ